MLTSLNFCAPQKLNLKPLGTVAVLVLFASAPLVANHQASTFWGGGWVGAAAVDVAGTSPLHSFIFLMIRELGFVG
jgi:hypothetical protein